MHLCRLRQGRDDGYMKELLPEEQFHFDKIIFQSISIT
nr:MAG TPA: hypothetical protein [Caudoviricetes sp.]